jgi:hypothetical protein
MHDSAGGRRVPHLLDLFKFPPSDLLIVAVLLLSQLYLRVKVGLVSSFSLSRIAKGDLSSLIVVKQI